MTGVNFTIKVHSLRATSIKDGTPVRLAILYPVSMGRLRFAAFIATTAYTLPQTVRKTQQQAFSQEI